MFFPQRSLLNFLSSVVVLFSRCSVWKYLSQASFSEHLRSDITFLTHRRENWPLVVCKRWGTDLYLCVRLDSNHVLTDLRVFQAALNLTLQPLSNELMLVLSPFGDFRLRLNLFLMMGPFLWRAKTLKCPFISYWLTRENSWDFLFLPKSKVDGISKQKCTSPQSKHSFFFKTFFRWLAHLKVLWLEKTLNNLRNFYISSC